MPPPPICDRVQIFYGAPTTSPVCQRSPTSCLSQGWYIMGWGAGAYSHCFLMPKTPYFNHIWPQLLFFPRRKKIQSQRKISPAQIDTSISNPREGPTNRTRTPHHVPPRALQTGLLPLGGWLHEPLVFPGDPTFGPLAESDPKASMRCPQKMGSGR